ncbi:hypothetical protein JW933_09795 [candidate division FCPU426 bacterium]|nr:hypothetical protein [candidate division FCPU426 bacterium]
MEVKGTAVAVMPVFLRKKFQEEGFQRWLQALSPEAQDIYSQPILSSVWYNLQTHLLEPTVTLCDLFYDGNKQGAFEVGQFSAEYALKGIYRLFVKMGSPEFILKKAAVIMTNYYRPSRLEVPLMEKNRAVLRIMEFAELHAVIEQRIAGWMQQALVISGVKNVNLLITSSLTKNQPFTEIIATWS